MKITKQYLKQLILEELQEATQDAGSKLSPEEQAKRLQAIMAKGGAEEEVPPEKSLAAKMAGSQQPAGSAIRQQEPLEKLGQAPKKFRDTFAKLKSSVKELQSQLQKTEKVSPWLTDAVNKIIEAQNDLGNTINNNLLPYIKDLQKSGKLGAVPMEEKKGTHK